MSKHLSNTRLIEDPLAVIPLTRLISDPQFAPSANIGRMVQCDDGNRYHAAVIDGAPVWLLNKTGGVVDFDGVTFIEELFLQEFPEDERPSAAANDRRLILNGDTDLPEISDGTEWRSLVDEARAAEIAEDIVADVIRPISETTVIEIAPNGTEIEGQRYVGNGALGRAFAYCSLFTSRYFPNDYLQRAFILNIKSGFTMREQINSFSVDLGHVQIFAEDAFVPVDRAFVLKAVGTTSQAHYAFNFGGGGRSPVISCLFKPTGSAPPPDPETALAPYTPRVSGYRITLGTRGTITFQQRDLEGALLATPKIAGFDEFYNNIACSGQLLMFRAVARNAEYSNIDLSGGEIAATTVDAVGGGTYCLIMSGGTLTLSADGQGDGAILTGVYGQRFRKNPASDSPDDMRVNNGGTIINRASLLLGGSNIPPNQFNANGSFFDVRFTAAQPVALPAFTVGTAPSAAATLGAMIYVSNGAAGSPVMAFSNGTNWLRCDTLAPISA